MRSMINKVIGFTWMMMEWNVNKVIMGKKLDMIKWAIKLMKLSLWKNVIKILSIKRGILNKIISKIDINR
jgi:hypothetical protein